MNVLVYCGHTWPESRTVTAALNEVHAEIPIEKIILPLHNALAYQERRGAQFYAAHWAQAHAVSVRLYKVDIATYRTVHSATLRCNWLALSEDHVDVVLRCGPPNALTPGETPMQRQLKALHIEEQEVSSPFIRTPEQAARRLAEIIAHPSTAGRTPLLLLHPYEPHPPALREALRNMIARYRYVLGREGGGVLARTSAQRYALWTRRKGRCPYCARYHPLGTPHQNCSPEESREIDANMLRRHLHELERWSNRA